MRGRALALVRATGGVAAVAVSLVAGMVLQSIGYRITFAVAGFIGLLGSFALLAMRVPAADDVTTPAAPAPPDPTGSLSEIRGAPRVPRGASSAGGLGAMSGPPDSTRRVTGDHAFTMLMASAFIFGLGCWIQVPARPVTLADIVNVSPATLGWLGAIGGVAAIAGSLTWRRLADRRSSVDALRFVYVAGTAATLAYLGAQSPWALVGGFVADALLQSGLELVWVIALIDVAGPRRAAQAAAVSLTLAGIRGVIGPPLGAALIAAFGVSGVYVVATGLMVTALLMLGRVLRVNAGAALGQPASPALVR